MQSSSNASAATRSVTVLRENYPADQLLPVVQAYRHLGSVQCFDGGLKQEVHQRVGQAWGAFREGRRKLFKNKLVEPSKRCAACWFGLFETLGTVGAGTWPPLRQGEYNSVRSALYTMMRATLCIAKSSDQHLHACTIRSQLSVNSPVALLHAARLRYARQMVQHAPGQFWVITKGDRPYCEQMLGSFGSLFARIKHTCSMPCPRVAWDAWSKVIERSPGNLRAG